MKGLFFPEGVIEQARVNIRKVKRMMVAVLCGPRFASSLDPPDVMPALRGECRQRPVVTPVSGSLRPYPDEIV